jgi:hypothetical protein
MKQTKKKARTTKATAKPRVKPTAPAVAAKPTKTPVPESAPVAAAKPAKRPSLPNAFSLFGESFQALRINPTAIVGLIVTPIIASVPVFFLIVTVLFTLGSAQRAGSPRALPYEVSVGIVLVYIAMAVLCLLTSAALTVATLRSARGESIRYTKAFGAGWRMFWPYTGLVLLIALIVAVGLVLFIVPGLLMLRRYALAPYYLLERKMGIRDAMEKSADDAVTYGGIWDLLLVILIIFMFGFIPGIGWVALIVLSVAYCCAPAIRYVQISNADGYMPEARDE